MLDLRPYLAIPYKHCGRSWDGADCWGFPILFFKREFNKQLPDVNNVYSKNWAQEGKNYFLDNYHKQFEKVNTPQPYDIILFQNRKGIANHCGIVLGYGKMVHCCRYGVMVDTYTRREWQTRFNGFYRMKNDAD
jgi:probable lipoprotein NlpC